MHIQKVIKDSGLKISYVAKQIGISRVRLSRIIHGHIPPKDIEKQNLAIFFKTKDLIFSCMPANKVAGQ